MSKGARAAANRIAIATVAAIVVIAAASFARGDATPATDASPVASPAGLANEPHQLPGRAVSVSGAVTITVSSTGFDPTYVESTNGHPLRITVVNAGQRPHGFVLDHFQIRLELQPGQTETVTIEQPPLGDFRYSSDLPGDETFGGMLTFYI